MELADDASMKLVDEFGDIMKQMDEVDETCGWRATVDAAG